MNVNTRVRSAWKAIASRSVMRAVWSSNVSGTPSGLSISSTSARASVFGLLNRGARSRARCRGSRSCAAGRARPASTGASEPVPVITSRMLRSSRPCRRRSASTRRRRTAVRSAARGLISIGRGVVGDDHEMVFMVRAAVAGCAAADVAGEVLGGEFQRRKGRRPDRSAWPAPGRSWCPRGSLRLRFAWVWRRSANPTQPTRAARPPCRPASGC